MLLFINQFGVREKISGKALIAYFNCDKLQNQNALLLTSKCAMKHMQKHKHTHKCPKKKKSTSDVKGGCDLRKPLTTVFESSSTREN